MLFDPTGVACLRTLFRYRYENLRGLELKMPDMSFIRHFKNKRRIFNGQIYLV